MGIEEYLIVPEVRPLKYTPKVRDVLLSVRGHCVIPLLARSDFIQPNSTPPTLFVIADEYHLPQCCLILGQYRQVIPSFNLTRLINDNRLDWDQRREPTLHDLAPRQRAYRAKDDSSPHQ